MRAEMLYGGRALHYAKTAYAPSCYLNTNPTLMAVRTYFEPPQLGWLEAEIFQSGLRLEDLIVLCYKLLQVPTTSLMSGFISTRIVVCFL
jgi:hypothetical protein